MIPSVLARQLQEGLSDYIETTFPMTNHAFRGSLTKMLNEKNSVFREPYVSVRLPFRLSAEEGSFFQSIHPKFKPYVHQQRAFERLTGDDGRSTVIATGTGSGKTECFLYPILEYCYRHRGEPGIKALIIYPMNALASDQAMRIAKEIYESPELRGNVTAGMYVGGFELNASTVMSKDRIITDRETILANPPDILLTNYKMLDYLLVRPSDASLWVDNAPDTLKYIAVDELHTFDGAQGTDLACLLRRLKARLYTQQGYLCCIGTSATMGEKDSAQYIKEYAGSIFGEIFEEYSVITEDRLSATEFFDGYNVEEFSFPNQEQCLRLQQFIDEEDHEGYLALAAESWFNEEFDHSDIMSGHTRLAIGHQLMKHSFTQELLALESGRFIQIEYVVESLRNLFPAIDDLENPSIAIDALYSLISHARTGTEDHLMPFLSIQVQLWIRELRRLLAQVSEDDIQYSLATDLNEFQAKHYLPVVNCRDCGETGWVGIRNERGNMTMSSLDTFYNLYFNQDGKIVMLYPHQGNEKPPGLHLYRLCPHCLQLDVQDYSASMACSSCGKESFPVLVPEGNILVTGSYRQFQCPFCGSTHGLSLIGLRSATAISAEISQLYSSTFNDDKKLLTFSDNVQDAAHRAGFFNARTWRFGLRSAIQRFAQREGDGLTLSDFQEKFVDYWHQEFSNEAFISHFIAPNMTWKQAYEQMILKERLGIDDDSRDLMNQVEKRVKYEIMLEFGMRARTGRTLEKSGCSIVGPDKDALERLYQIVLERTVNELGVPTSDPETKIRNVIIGFINMLRLNGAYDDPTYQIFTQNEGKTYLLSNASKKWLPGARSGQNIPRFIAKKTPHIGRLNSFDELSPSSKYVHWVTKCIDEPIMSSDTPQLVAEIVMEELLANGLLVTMLTPATYSVYGLNKAKMHVSVDVSQMVCDLCGAVVSTAEENKSYWEGAPCTRSKCSGHLVEDRNKKLGYYGKLYSKGDMVRVIAREHTGLLQRSNREELESAFKQKHGDRNPWDPNLLSSTPTLEMGIDIGDLSTVVLCSMPPSQAQYVQRTGRAGRQDGNSLIVTVANAKPHDLYFYAEPSEMIQGVVEPPKIFLRASAVLERQFVAYCMDNWVKRGADRKAVPDNLGVCLNNLDSQRRSVEIFPFNYLTFVQNNLSSLVRTFTQMFSHSDGGMDDDSIRELELFAKGDRLKESPMHFKVLEAFEAIKDHKDSIQDNIKQLRTLIREIDARPHDSAYEEDKKELRSEFIALTNVVYELDKKNVFNFLSDEGLLPNYAFPESGVILKALLWRKEMPEEEPEGESRRQSKKATERLVFEYGRGAASALGEFAPANSFYVDGKRLEINQIDMLTAQYGRWRLCPNCSYAEDTLTGSHRASCPRCGDPGWADNGQIQSMLKPKMVYSNMPYEEAQISDDRDDRNMIFYLRQLLVEVDDQNDIQKAFQIENDEFTFGYEFVKKAILREINFGERDIQGPSFPVAGINDVRKGFKICKFCGYLQPQRGEAKHSYTCRARRDRDLGQETYEECLFLYREIVTEVLRVLIPATTLDFSRARLESFVAAFLLGLKEYFGNVDHLAVAMTDVPVEDANHRKQYLVIYDSVPGGTGYLKQLLQNDRSLIEIFEKSLTVLENCSCGEDPQKDGCYRCLYAYRQSRSIGEISRKTAIQLLRKILQGKENIKAISGLSAVPTNSLLESELERMFIQALELMAEEDRPVHIEKALVNQKEGYLLKVGNCIWEIEPQLTLDAYDGVLVKTRPDFILRPIRNTENQMPIAVYADGFQFHKNIVSDDSLKREAIRRSGRYRVWTFSYKDVEHVFKLQGDYATDTLSPTYMPSGPQFYVKTITNSQAESLKPDQMTAFEIFMFYLGTRGAEEIFQSHARAISLSLLDTQQTRSNIDFVKWQESVNVFQSQVGLSEIEFQFGSTAFGIRKPLSSENHLRIFSGIAQSEMEQLRYDALPSVFAILNDLEDERMSGYEKDWNGFWQFFNVMQFSENFFGLTERGIREFIYHELKAKDKEIAKDDYWHIPEDDAWSKTIELLLGDEAFQLASSLRTLGIKAPSHVGYELTDENEMVVAECEMAWEAEKTGALVGGQIEDKDKFIGMGWTMFGLNDEVPQEIIGR